MVVDVSVVSFFFGSGLSRLGYSREIRFFGISRGVGGAVIPNGVRNLVRWGTRPCASLRVTMQWGILTRTTPIPKEPEIIIRIFSIFGDGSGRSPDRARLGCGQRKFWAEGPNETLGLIALRAMPATAIYHCLLRRYNYPKIASCGNRSSDFSRSERLKSLLRAKLCCAFMHEWNDLNSRTPLDDNCLRL